MTCKEHPKYELPNTPHAKHRYESAMKHVEAAKAAGKSSEEIHAIFKKVMEFDIKDVEKLPAVDACYGWRFSGAKNGVGQKIRCYTYVPITFRLRSI